jgi:transcriptional regulator with XRE-family HTH domain
LETTRPRPLIELRLEQGLSRRVLARLAGCSPATIYSTESGRRIPIPQTARKLAAALGVRLVEVAEFEAAMDEWTGRNRQKQIVRA